MIPRSFSKLDIGKKRRENQDYLFASDSPVGDFANLYVIADGMGGHNAGDVASSLCVNEFVRIAEKGGRTLISTLYDCVNGAGALLRTKALENTELEGMGTTLVGATIVDDLAYVFNAGDSRLYIFDGELRQITVDHSLVEEMVKNGEINREEARFHPRKNVVTRALTSEGPVVPDIFEVPLKKGDILLLCSDGLTTMLSDFEIDDILLKNGVNIERSVSKLIERANDNGGNDNISVILVRIDDK